MNTKTIYLCGSITGLTPQLASEWRKRIKNKLQHIAKDIGVSIKVFDPCTYYNYETTDYDSEHEVRQFELHMLKKSDLVIVNLANFSKSIGSSQELAIADEYRIPVIALNEDKQELHPWIEDCIWKSFDDENKMIEYITYYYLQ